MKKIIFHYLITQNNLFSMISWCTSVARRRKFSKIQTVTLNSSYQLQESEETYIAIF